MHIVKKKQEKEETGRNSTYCAELRHANKQGEKNQRRIHSFHEWMNMQVVDNQKSQSTGKPYVL